MIVAGSTLIRGLRKLVKELKERLSVNSLKRLLEMNIFSGSDPTSYLEWEIRDSGQGTYS